MRHPLPPKELDNKSAEFASQFVEATGDLISLTHAVSETVQKWFDRHEGRPESSGD